MADLKAFAEQLVNLTVKEVNELATITVLLAQLKKVWLKTKQNH